MAFNLNDLRVIYPEQLWLELSDIELEYAWQLATAQPYSNNAARWRAFLNHLCLNTFLAWLKEDSDWQGTPDIWPHPAALSSFWEVVNGTGLTLGETRLVLVPSDKSNLQEFQVPQEWVDIPSWAAQYYLAVQLNLEESWLRVWGYATHEQIRKEARYDWMERTYCLEREELIENLNVMWVAQRLCSPKKIDVQPIPALLPEQTEKLLEQLSQWTPYSPRLDVSFEQWAALLASPESRQCLYRQRLENLPENTVACSPSLVNNLSQWFHNSFDAGWQSLDTLLTRQPRTLAVQFRTDAALNEVRVKGAKLIDLGMQLQGQRVMLLVGLTSEIDDKVSIRVQLHPANGEMYLPANLRLILVSQTGKMLQEVTSRSHDHYIQLKRFKTPSGKSFSIQVVLNDVSIKEEFAIEPLVRLQS
ncbi:MAG TPA: DUF1822 family protein [Coleofasciculaceae cyanobacterium]